MQFTFEQDWRTARALENKGDFAGAKAIYDALIASDSNRLYVRLRLADIERHSNHYGAARAHALRAAETVRMGRWKDLAAVTRLLLTFDEREIVHDLIMGADWTSEEVITQSAVLSQHLWLIEEVDESLRLIDAAQKRAPSSHLLSYSRANALRYFGKIEEATSEYERCLALMPDYPYAHWSLAYHAKSVPLGQRIDRVRKSLSRLPETAPGHEYLHYALFKEFDDAGEHPSAWHHLTEGARRKRRQLKYDGDLEARGLAEMEVLVSGLPPPKANTSNPEICTPLFVLGMPRTGTTVLERILGNLDAVTAGGELNAFHTALCLHSDRFLGTGLTPTMVESLREIDLDKVGDTYLERTSYLAPAGRFVVDKNPMNFALAGLIGQALPAAKILCLRRGGMDACFSNLKELFPSDAYGYSYDLRELGNHFVRFHRLCSSWQRAMPERFMIVNYEDLVTQPEATSKKVMDFCGLAFSEECVDITRNSSAVSTASSSQVRQPINTKGIGGWKNYAKQLMPLQSILDEAGLT